MINKSNLLPVTSSASSLEARTLLKILLGSWAIAIAAQIAIPLPFTPVPITGQTFAILAIAIALKPTEAFATVGAYLLQGTLGLPFFASGASGFGLWTGATAGYLAAFPLAAWIVSTIAGKLNIKRIRNAFLVAFIGHLVIFAVGVTVLKIVLAVNITTALSLGFIPFIPGLILKTALLAIVAPLIVAPSIPAQRL